MQRCFIARLSETLGDGQVSFAQFFMLSHITAQDGLNMSEIAERMNHTTAAATGLVDRLEKLGYVERSIALHDRRKV
ncbi:MAG: MarR family winged helix-turn-helix transcriptional regulator, partial [Chthoniobacterales bacterium]